MMKGQFKKVMSYFFNFGGHKMAKKKSRSQASSAREHLESESQYVIKRLNEGGVAPRDNVSFSRYTPLPKIGEGREIRIHEHEQQQQQYYQSDEQEYHSRRNHREQQENHSRQQHSKEKQHQKQQDHVGVDRNHVMNQSDTLTPTTSHIITYKFSPVQVRQVSHQLSPLPAVTSSRSRGSKEPRETTELQCDNTAEKSMRPRLMRQDTYIVTDPVVIKGSLFEYLRLQDNMVTRRVHPPEKSRKSHENSGRSPEKSRRSKKSRIPISPEAVKRRTVPKVSDSKQRLNEVKAKFKKALKERRDKEEGGFWFEL